MFTAYSAEAMLKALVLCLDVLVLRIKVRSVLKSAGAFQTTLTFSLVEQFHWEQKPQLATICGGNGLAFLSSQLTESCNKGYIPINLLV